MNVNFNNIKQIKKLGFGAYGTTYLVFYNKKKYALKIQNILQVHKKKNYKYELWRELDLYEYINHLNKEDQKFFTKLYAYEIYDNCKHIQIRSFKLSDDQFSKKLKKLDESKWCVTFLLDYQGKTSFGKYIATHHLSINQTYSFIFQIIKIMLILYKGGYSHNDLHMENLMIKKTNEKYFIFNKTNKIPYYGYQLIVIDYGEVMHNKFNIKYNGSNRLFTINRKKWLFDEINNSLYSLITNVDKYMYHCTKKKKLQPWENKNFDPITNLIQNIINRHSKFWNESKLEYNSNIDVAKLLHKIELNQTQNTPIRALLKNEPYKYDTFKVLSKIKSKFLILYPKLQSKYFNWCSYHKLNIPKNDYLTILKITNLTKLLQFLYTKLN